MVQAAGQCAGRNASVAVASISRPRSGTSAPRKEGSGWARWRQGACGSPRLSSCPRRCDGLPFPRPPSKGASEIRWSDRAERFGKAPALRQKPCRRPLRLGNGHFVMPDRGTVDLALSPSGVSEPVPGGARVRSSAFRRCPGGTPPEGGTTNERPTPPAPTRNRLSARNERNENRFPERISCLKPAGGRFRMPAEGRARVPETRGRTNDQRERREMAGGTKPRPPEGEPAGGPIPPAD